MAFHKIVSACLAFCITATLAVAACGCDDLGAYEDTEEYYASFGDVVLIHGTSKEEDPYSVADSFYNKASRKNFLAGEENAYRKVDYSDYVYMAIPLENTIVMDTLALYLQSQTDVTVYINVFVTNSIPSDWKAIADLEYPPKDDEESGDGADTEKTETETETEPEESISAKDPHWDTRIGEVTVHLKGGKWGSFALDYFSVDGKTQKSIQINKNQYILLQIRNNSGVREFDKDKQAYVDPQTRLELPKATITMTNLLVRALEIKNGNEVQKGE